MSVNIEDKIVLLKETISNLNTQYGNKLDYRGPSHYISLHIIQKEVNLDWTGHRVVILEITLKPTPTQSTPHLWGFWV